MDPELNQQILALYHQLLRHRFEGFLDAVVAYSSLTVIYDPYHIYMYGQTAGKEPGQSVRDWVSRQLIKAWEEASETSFQPAHHRIPVCYHPSLGTDLETLAAARNRHPEELIHWHCQPVYRIYMIGFLPGFPYMGEIVPELQSPRKAKPAPVAAGSVAIAGKQTGIYSLPSPGGWQILGRTPVRLFDPQAEVPVPFSPGDEVSFYPISLDQFEQLKQESDVGTNS